MHSGANNNNNNKYDNNQSMYIRSLGTNFNNCSTTERTNPFDQSLSEATNERIVWTLLNLYEPILMLAGPRCNFRLKSICTQFICDSLYSQLEHLNADSAFMMQRTPFPYHADCKLWLLRPNGNTLHKHKLIII